MIVNILVSNNKFLRVIIIDDKLSWNSVMQYTMSRNIGILRQLRFLPENVLKLLYHSLISSHFSYCSTIFCCSSKHNSIAFIFYKKGTILYTCNYPFTLFTAFNCAIFTGENITQSKRFFFSNRHLYAQ